MPLWKIKAAESSVFSRLIPPPPHFLFFLSQLGVTAVLAGPLKNVQVNLRGKKYDISDVTTVKDLQEQVQKAAGIDSAAKHSVLFGGKRLEADAVLSEAGVEEGSQLNMVPGSPSTSSKTTKTKVPPVSAATTSTSTSSAEGTKSMMEDYLKQAGVDSSKLDDLMKGMGGGEGGMPSMQESLSQMKDMMNSPIFQEYMNDPKRLEESRQMILNNPMLKGMMGGMPGMEELLNDPEKWREAMTAAASLYKNMDPDDIMKAMGGMGGPGGGGMPPGGLFDGTLENSAAAKALDELDEDD